LKRKSPTNYRLAERLKRETRGEVLFDDFSRGLYSTDASIYQIIPAGVLVLNLQMISPPHFKLHAKRGSASLPEEAELPNADKPSARG